MGQAASCGREHSWLTPKKHTWHDASERAPETMRSPDAFSDLTATEINAAVFTPHAVGWWEENNIRIQIRIQYLVPKFYANWAIYFFGGFRLGRASLTGDSLWYD
ncbi:MAG: hypothetical protein ACYC6B_03080 [Thermoleophilia bacterium]